MPVRSANMRRPIIANISPRHGRITTSTMAQELQKKMREFIEEVIEANAHFPDQVLTDPFSANLGILNRVRKRGEAGL